jgi:hypothetical protein
MLSIFVNVEYVQMSLYVASCWLFRVIFGGVVGEVEYKPDKGLYRQGSYLGEEA